MNFSLAHRLGLLWQLQLIVIAATVWLGTQASRAQSIPVRYDIRLAVEYECDCSPPGSGVLPVVLGTPSYLPILIDDGCQPICYPDMGGAHPIVTFENIAPCLQLSVAGGWYVLSNTVYIDCCSWIDPIETVTVNVGKYSGDIEVGCPNPLVADGKSQVPVWYVPPDGTSPGHLPLPGPLTWSLVRNPGDAWIIPTGPKNAILFAGIAPGVARIRATGTNGCFVERDVDVLDPNQSSNHEPEQEAGTSSASSCGSCTLSGASSQFGSGSPVTSSQNPGFSFGLGSTFPISNGGKIEGPTGTKTLEFRLGAIPKQTYDLEDFAFPWSESDVTVVRTPSEAMIRQLLVPEGLVDIVDENGDINVHFYARTNATPSGTDGFIGTGTPLVTWHFECESLGAIRLREIRPGQPTRTFRFDWVFDEVFEQGHWVLTRPDNVTIAMHVSSASSVRTETTVANSGGASARTYIREFTALPIGERLTKEVIGAGSHAETNTYSYYTNGLLRLVERHDGYWEYYLYDAEMRPTNIFSAYGHQPVTTNKALCRLVEHSYDPSVVAGSGDDGSLSASTPRRTVEYVLGQEVSRRYTVVTRTATKDIQCVTAGAAWSASDNLVTISVAYTNGLWFGRPRSVERPDGTMDIHEYTFGGSVRNSTNIVYSGVPGTQKTNILDGTKTVTILGPLGQLISTETVDILSDRVVSRRTYGAFDSFQRSQSVTNLDGTWEYSQRFCCGDTITTNREGTVTTKTYDSMKRLLTTTTSGITLSNVYDGLNRIVSVVRFGTNGIPMVLEQRGYDAAGHLHAQTNALGEVQLFTEASGPNGERTNTTTYLTNGVVRGTRIEVRYRDGTLQSVGGTLAHGVRYEYGPTNGGTFTKEIKLEIDGDDTPEWTTTFYDMLGRPYKTLYADGAFSQTFYDSAGRVWKEVDPDGVTTLYQYDAHGDREYTVLDLNRNDTIDFNGTDRITRNVHYVTNDPAKGPVQWSATYVWLTNGVNTPTLLSVSEVSVNGLTNWVMRHGLTTRTETTYAGGGVRYVKVIAPDNTYTLTRFENGRVMETTRYDGATQLSSTTYGYDEHGRQKFITDARNGTTTNTFDAADRVVAVSTPAPGNGAPAQVTRYGFDALGRGHVVTNADGTVLNKEYFDTGELKKTWGAREYPAEYNYDWQGRMTTLKTWQDFTGDSGAATTTWHYDLERGFMTNKVYADGKGTGYRYTPAGRLRQRNWARGVTTTYTTNAAGEVASVAYNDSTPGETRLYDRRGSLSSVVRTGLATNTFTYSEAGLVTSETQSGVVVSNRYDQYLRRTNISVLVGGNLVASTGYHYDSAGRLWQVTDGTNTATYSYVANSPLVSQILFTSNGVTRMTTTKSYDFLNRLLGITNQPAVDTLASFTYGLNSANQRTSITNADGSRWLFGYDALGQVTSGKRYWSDGSAVLGQQFEYAFDDIGNRKTATSGGDAFGRNKRVQVYSANLLNQYTSRTVPGWLEIHGTATNTATVTVNNGPTTRQGDYYRAELAVPNDTAAMWQSISNVAVLPNGSTDYVTNATGNLFVPKTPELFTFDFDGNLTSDGRWTNTWDAENRLLTMTSHASGPSGSRVSLTFAYDHQSRRISKVVSNWTGSAWMKVKHERFIYDGWNLIAILDSQSSLLSRFAWGSDLSGSLQSAGGVGGLLFLATSGTTAFAGSDGNGNVATLVSATTGTSVAQYEYDPFGRVLRATGPMALTNPFRFSTKWQDDETGLNYYGYRYYDAQTGRWWGRDPIEEQGGRNVYAFVENELPNLVDIVGLAGLEFFSEGIALFDPPLIMTWKISGSGTESGYRRSTTDAYFTQTAVQVNADGGICNSGDPGRGRTSASSYVKAWVKNTQSCAANLDCTCTITYSGSTTAPRQVGGFGVFATILNKPFYKRYFPKNADDGRTKGWVASGAGVWSNQKRFVLQPGASQVLYDGDIPVAVQPDMPGAGFSAAMDAKCSCSSRWN
jgi:RHS repeat-associated protein